MLQTDRVLGIVLLLVSTVLLWVVVPSQTSAVSYGSTSPSLFPSLGVSAIGLGGLWLLIAPTLHRLPDLRVPAGAIAVALFGVAGFLAIQAIGYVWMAPVFTLTLMLIAGQRDPKWLLFGGVASPLGIWALFVLVLERSLP
ncbi:tripartite tricarboxylate transporter TctB family protein [Paracoccus saliphilus]|uniref:Tripartite tricarboxylate transporter TctB family protein n=1 Tax=Paracoccus saliphilus TaxID=405559 RepID=A0AA46A7E4_9RHOB|nr:tripartite tricarboxylate transporter TctB family protein [Paracoccus saliphilus]WCR01558.1 tripartite tricarboxylate transporter TctB family protein [Paracoccus saliphilus]SIT12438.1 Tripartite tricarboxylate transporter TctB family protein [Paracoccus saliphilus]